jgi:ABC-type branched-subunit amino acid transport system ATPase component
MLELVSVIKSFDANVAVNQVSLRVDSCQLTALIGPNGAGKTTVLDLISGFLSPDEGLIRFDGTDLFTMKAWQRAARWVTRTFQHVRDTASLTCLENVQLCVRHQAGANLLKAVVCRRMWRRQESEVAEHAHCILSDLGISDLSSRRAGDLSFGQRKLLALAGALAHDGDLFLLDEPFSGLDTAKKDTVARVLCGLSTTGKHVLFVEHNLHLVNLISNRVVALDRGRVIADGMPNEVLASTELMRAYTR